MFSISISSPLNVKIKRVETKLHENKYKRHSHEEHTNDKGE